MGHGEGPEFAFEDPAGATADRRCCLPGESNHRRYGGAPNRRIIASQLPARQKESNRLVVR
jgi:hypothetical protein